MIKVARFELYPKDEPLSWCVGFVIEVGIHNAYLDTTIPVTECFDLEPEAVTKLAYLKLKDSIDKIITNFEDKLPIIGTEFNPDDL